MIILEKLQLFIFKFQLGVPTKELIKLKMNTTLNLDYISKSLANDSIDISMQLSDNLQTTSDDHYILPIFYNQPITNNSECSRICR